MPRSSKQPSQPDLFGQLADSSLPDPPVTVPTHPATPPRLPLDAALGSVEDWAFAHGHTLLLGTDEVGRGPLCGPVVASAVVLQPDGARALLQAGLHDSKKLREAQREALWPQVQALALAHATVFVSAADIDQMNILRASQHAMWLALEQVWAQLQALGPALPQLLAVDGHLPVAQWTRTPQWPVVKGDSKSVTIAAASVLAKVARDRHMVALDPQYPGYGLAGHKGYPTAIHLAALRQLGPCPEHRRSFRGVVSGAAQP